MKCRNTVKNGSIKEPVFFGSYGKDTNDHSLFAQSFVEQQEAVVQSLEQQLQVLRTELWYDVNFGLPLFNKVNKSAIDSNVCATVLMHAEVIRIISFESVVINHNYSCKMQILSTFGSLDLTI